MPRACCSLFLACLASLAVAADETRTETLDWGTVTVPVTAAVGDRIAVVVTFAPGAVTADGVLAVHLPWWDASTRYGVMSHAKTAVKTGDTGPFTLHLPIKPQTGLTKVAATVFVSPDGVFRNRVLGTEVGSIRIH